MAEQFSVICLHYWIRSSLGGNLDCPGSGASVSCLWKSDFLKEECDFVLFKILALPFPQRHLEFALCLCAGAGQPCAFLRLGFDVVFLGACSIVPARVLRKYWLNWILLLAMFTF